MEIQNIILKHKCISLTEYNKNIFSIFITYANGSHLTFIYFKIKAYPMVKTLKTVLID